jgi:hypothetical protein
VTLIALGSVHSALEMGKLGTALANAEAALDEWECKPWLGILQPSPTRDSDLAPTPG